MKCCPIRVVTACCTVYVVMCMYELLPTLALQLTAYWWNTTINICMPMLNLT